MALKETRRYYRIEGTDAMIHLPENQADIFDQECRKLVEKLNLMADKLGYKGHSQESVSVEDICEPLS